MIQGLHHVQITIPRGQENAARDFYCGLLGLKELTKPASLQANGGFWLEAPSGLQVHVGAEDYEGRDKTKAHIAYLVANLDQLMAGLVKYGLKVTMGSPIPGMQRCEARDPFGNRMEFVQLTANL